MIKNLTDKKHIAVLIISVFLAAFLSGCAEFDVAEEGAQEQQKPATVDGCLKAALYADADAIVEAKAREQSPNDKILYLFDKGSIQQIMGNYKESTKYLHDAETLIDTLYTKSVSAEVSSFFTNDLSLPYEGEDFEQVMVNVIKALNFMYQGDFSGARVEVKKTNNRLLQISDKMEGKNEYKEDAFARYISAFCYEANGELNDAYIDYKKSFEAYEQYNANYGTAIPDVIKKDLLRLSEALHFTEQYGAYKEKFGFMPYTKQADMKGKGEVLLIIYDGQAPDKLDNGEATPYFKDKGSYVSSVEVTTEEDKTYMSYVSEDITQIAIKNLAQKMDLIQAKNLARGAVKEIAGEVAKQGIKEVLKNVPFGDMFGGMVVDAAKQASELADTRSWKILPGRFQLVRFPALGAQQVKVKMFLKDGSQREKIIKVKLKAGAKKAIPVYCFQ
jgi:uncharacterized protein